MAVPAGLSAKQMFGVLRTPIPLRPVLGSRHGNVPERPSAKGALVGGHMATVAFKMTTATTPKRCAARQMLSPNLGRQRSWAERIDARYSKTQYLTN